MAIEIGSIVLIWPYCNPAGKLGEVIEYREDMDDAIWIIKYLDGSDSFGRNRVNHYVGDKQIRVFGSSKDINLDTLRVLYGNKSNDG